VSGSEEVPDVPVDGAWVGKLVDGDVVGPRVDIKGVGVGVGNGEGKPVGVSAAVELLDAPEVGTSVGKLVVGDVVGRSVSGNRSLEPSMEVDSDPSSVGKKVGKPVGVSAAEELPDVPEDGAWVGTEMVGVVVGRSVSGNRLSEPSGVGESVGSKAALLFFFVDFFDVFSSFFDLSSFSVFSFLPDFSALDSFADLVSFDSFDSFVDFDVSSSSSSSSLSADSSSSAAFDIFAFFDSFADFDSFCDLGAFVVNSVGFTVGALVVGDWEGDSVGDLLGDPVGDFVGESVRVGLVGDDVDSVPFSDFVDFSSSDFVDLSDLADFSSSDFIALSDLAEFSSLLDLNCFTTSSSSAPSLSGMSDAMGSSVIPGTSVAFDCSMRSISIVLSSSSSEATDFDVFAPSTFELTADFWLFVLSVFDLTADFSLFTLSLDFSLFMLSEFDVVPDLELFMLSAFDVIVVSSCDLDTFLYSLSSLIDPMIISVSLDEPSAPVKIILSVASGDPSAPVTIGLASADLAKLSGCFRLNSAANES